MPKTKMARSYGNYVVSLLRNCQNDFQSGYVILHLFQPHPTQQYISDSVSPYPHQYLALPLFRVLVILIGEQ